MAKRLLCILIGVVMIVCISGCDKISESENAKMIDEELEDSIQGTWVCEDGHHGGTDYLIVCDNVICWQDGDNFKYEFEDGLLIPEHTKNDVGRELKNGELYERPRSFEDLEEQAVDCDFYYDIDEGILGFYDDSGDRVYKFEKVSDDYDYNQEVYDKVKDELPI